MRGISGTGNLVASHSAKTSQAEFTSADKYPVQRQRVEYIHATYQVRSGTLIFDIPTSPYVNSYRTPLHYVYFVMIDVAQIHATELPVD